ncbi:MULTISPECIES: hypothetical protein [unclassified Oceanispirochaeta]|nr:MULTISPECIES: hypothetical protein [unclassified Oceanispirochaeta]RDG31480.1 hypothetical protein DV872_12410 [Oceanispirochaeta sp. M1]
MLIITVSILMSFWHGRLAGLLTLGISLLMYCGGQIFLFNEIPELLQIFNVLSLGILLIYLGGALRKLREYKMTKIMRRFRRNSEERNQLSKISHAQQDIIQELEERVTRQKDAINLLYDRIHEIDCLDTNLSISKLLDTLTHFTEAEALSLWVYDPSLNKLRLRMRKGDEQEGEQPILDLKESIEGWVFRNNQLFSMRMTLDYDNLNQLNSKNSIMCFPVVLDNKTWGVVNIESLPFIKYSEYTENLVQIIISLAQPALKKALDFENLLMGEEQHDITGLPQFTQLYRILDKNRYDESGTINSSSLILIEFQEYPELIDEYGTERIIKLQAELSKSLADKQINSPELFHYRDDSKMALYVPHMDFDGCSLFCLEALESINSKSWDLDGKKISPDVNLGYASSGTGEKMDPDDLIKRAEFLLEIQKI